MKKEARVIRCLALILLFCAAALAARQYLLNLRKVVCV